MRFNATVGIVAIALYSAGGQFVAIVLHSIYSEYMPLVGVKLPYLMQLRDAVVIGLVIAFVSGILVLLTLSASVE